MAEETQPISKVTVEKRLDGKYFYALTFRGVTYPVKGPFLTPMEAAASGQATLKALEERNGPRKA